MARLYLRARVTDGADDLHQMPKVGERGLLHRPGLRPPGGGKARRERIERSASWRFASRVGSSLRKLEARWKSAGRLDTMNRVMFQILFAKLRLASTRPAVSSVKRSASVP